MLEALSSILRHSEALKNVATVVGLIVGGWWTYRLFIKRREDETALGIDLACTSHPYHGQTHLLFVEVVLTNKGKVRLTATDRSPAWSHQSGSGRREVKHAVDLELRRIPDRLPHGSIIDTWSPGGTAGPTAPAGIEANLATGYVKADSDDTDFWMEPNEKYALGVPIVLGEGLYLATVTFVGRRPDYEFWRRSVVIRVPCPVLSPAGVDAGCVAAQRLGEPGGECPPA